MYLQPVLSIQILKYIRPADFSVLDTGKDGKLHHILFEFVSPWNRDETLLEIITLLREDGTMPTYKGGRMPPIPLISLEFSRDIRV
jgi:hypothetical protein